MKPSCVYCGRTLPPTRMTRVAIGNIIFGPLLDSLVCAECLLERLEDEGEKVSFIRITAFTVLLISLLAIIILNLLASKCSANEGSAIASLDQHGAGDLRHDRRWQSQLCGHAR